MEKNIKNKVIYISLIVLCLIALIGFILPSIIIDVDMMGNSRSMSLSMQSFINRPENPFGGSALNASSSGIASRFGDMDLFDFSSDMFGEIRPKMITSVGAYFISLILLIVVLIFTIINKLKKISIFLSAASFALLVYAGNTILTIPGPLMDGLMTNIENSLGFLAMFINIADLINFNVVLGNGYWLTLITIGCLIIFKIASLIILKKHTDIEENNDNQSKLQEYKNIFTPN